MRQEKLSGLDDQYCSKEIEFLKQAQSKGQISVVRNFKEEFHR
ncbi:hypothetical protein CNO14_07150 (plasmid) [Borrelia miyamotoi]|uniref:Uncharacterized protein n=2 Tax=Borrelia miyamotoi TaxID=47466 RepID=A0AAQ3CMJ2_9SPIR|nr:hypothetical protein [Borrelia miyamotoi]AHH05831.1 Putative membrane spanning protein [Borrelia miyamotoi FR64b]WAZ71062.1 hypothetical protein O5403_05205 [Borrelia miyamotoi]WCB91041.1 hypothetical protein CNO11_07285 [Borrelia miyamotoi]WCL22173.1 hypothetical protein CNO10_07335 [Borrelia miyamotoi]WDE70432.1 hypothetical protein CNO12_07490 [Borrelia miyamotoi]